MALASPGTSHTRQSERSSDPEAPQGEGLNAESLSDAHLVEGSNGIEEPDVVAIVAIVAVAEVRVEGIVVVIDVFLGIAGTDPGFLYGNAFILFVGRQLPFLRAFHPVIAVVADGTNELLFGDGFDREVQVGGEPILRGNGTGRATGKVLVIVHDDDAIDRGGNGLVIVIRVADLDADVKLHSPGMQVGRKLVQQSDVAGLPFLGERFEIDHQSAVTIGGEKNADLAAEARARIRSC